MTFNLFSTYVQLELKAKILLAEVLLKGFKQSVSDSSHALMWLSVPVDVMSLECLLPKNAIYWAHLFVFGINKIAPSLLIGHKLVMTSLIRLIFDPT